MVTINLERVARGVRRLAGVGALVGACLTVSGPAWSFDTGPHFNITGDALGAEGFGKTATEVVQMNNWFVDMYEKATDNPYSGHAGWFRTLVAGAYGDREHWSDSVIAAADATHFDSTDGGYPNVQKMTQEWDRLQRSIYGLARSARTANDPLKLLTVLGASLHQVQDFYAHTNWVEPQGGPGQNFDGPGWADRGLGEAPTWFDLPAEVRNAERLYAAGTRGIERQHGHWDDEGNKTMKKTMNKDWSGRPYFLQAYTSAYYATRQWVQAVRAAVNDEAFWKRCMAYSDRMGGALDHEIRGAFGMSVYSGHWDGQGEPNGAHKGPGSALIALRQATNSYFEGRAKTAYRQKFEGLIEAVAEPNVPPTTLVPVPSSQPMQKTHQLIRLQINEMTAIDDPDFGFGNDADYYAEVEIGDQKFQSQRIHGHNSFKFPAPHGPFTFLKALPRTARFKESLCNMQIEVKTSSSWWSGTNDSVYLRINDTKRFKLDKPLYDDFEGGDRDTYSIPLDNERLTIGDIKYLQIEKSKDGIAGGWKLEGIKVLANGKVIYDNQKINKWLEDDHLTYRATGFTARNPDTREVPVRIRLMDFDTLTANEHCDIHPDHDRYDAVMMYDPARGEFRGDAGGVHAGTIAGGDRYGGRLDDDDRARIRFRLDTMTTDNVPVTVRATPGKATGLFLLP